MRVRLVGAGLLLHDAGEPSCVERQVAPSQAALERPMSLIERLLGQNPGVSSSRSNALRSRSSLARNSVRR
jgi:hypothetical protein